MKLSPRQSALLLGGGFLLVLGLAAAVVFHFRPEEKEPETLNVPLGVEQAAIVTYSGPTLAVAPYKWGVAVNARIAQISERPEARVYDVRYIVNRAGTFDLKDYLVSADGTTLEGLPSFHFTGDPKLSKTLDNRIQETEEIKVEVGGHYKATLTALAVFWVGWLLLLIFYKRPRKAPPAPPPPPEPTLAELLRGFLPQLTTGGLDAAAKRKMEMVLFRRWREELALRGEPMSVALEKIAQHEGTGSALRKVEHWLHHRASPLGTAEIAAVIAPHAEEPRAVEAAAKP